LTYWILFEYTSPIELEQGEHLYACEGGRLPDSDRGLSFIASGLLKIERDSNISLARNSRKAGTLKSFDVWKTNQSLSNLRARGGTIGKQAALLKASSTHGLGVASFVRLARVGPGWIAGTLEQADVSQLTTYHVAVSKCKIHHLPYHKIEQIQEKDPTLVLRLYKVLAHLTAKRQEITIGHLMTLHSIMTSPAPGKPMRRTTNRGSSNFDRSLVIL
jgi:CRP-like cAMP-binding protein